MSSLPPVLYHHFITPLPYVRTLALQEALHKLQLSQRAASGNHQDMLLLLQHRPVYTSGRRQTREEIAPDRRRLMRLGADFVETQRGGQLTYHGPGQLVAYPLLDLGRWTPTLSIREYIGRLQNLMRLHFWEGHHLATVPLEHTGVFLDSRTKAGSIGVQVRHRLTTHGLAFNITSEPIVWFDEIVACGLSDVRAGSIMPTTRRGWGRYPVDNDIPHFVKRFGKVFEREMQEMDLDEMGEVGELIADIEVEAEKARGCLEEPLYGRSASAGLKNLRLKQPLVVQRCLMEKSNQTLSFIRHSLRTVPNIVFGYVYGLLIIPRPSGHHNGTSNFNLNLQQYIDHFLYTVYKSVIKYGRDIHSLESLPKPVHADYDTEHLEIIHDSHGTI
ncbi:hypothetical protein EW146_g8519 [Bondarzewia mesenterica]|uniref:lipoyl(octanoyl) transferase n=1 Tax=Bondarzewia mesenterica TaxID=1095465 RepID=A0A4S4LJA5_9AGAM|nr:hypothetical protein EW146_g8519 [Bondarzewia mesenterica]